MKRLLLTSHALGNRHSRKLFSKFLEEFPPRPIVGYIPNAQPNPNGARLRQKFSTLKRMGCNPVLIDLRFLKGAKLKKKLDEVDILFVGGGNTFYLLDMLRKSGFTKILPKLIKQGKGYIGSSAGSYVACPTIEAGTWKPNHSDRNFVGLKNLKALNLVPFLITAHFQEKYRPIITDASSRTKYPIAALYDTQAVYVRGNKYKVLGVGRKEYFNKFKSPGSTQR
ncbi:MAG: Type 1 glutamine amidotransferase-like domain-containing protein [Candidatus Micrarchaeota archaeon]|nr:Type 1 glutamine amidotransferase-like domain-containing protein [Candidatus Micrarchaeota archaeon]